MIFKPSGVISLTTDFGYSSVFVGVMKAVIINRCAKAQLIDLFHEVQPYNVNESGFWLRLSYQYFPAGTIHLAIVDPGVGSARRIILAQAAGHIFLAPDNGLLDQALQGLENVQYRQVQLENLKPLSLPKTSATFHGRDIFAPLAAGLLAGTIACDTVGPLISDIILSSQQAPVYKQGIATGHIMSIDHFGNLISNIEGQCLPYHMNAVVELAGVSIPMCYTYADAKPGEIIALLNSFGMLEIACVQGSAAEKLSIHRGAQLAIKKKI